MDLKQLEYFVTIVEEGNITSASRKLHMAQPPLSCALKSLEEELEVILAVRGSRKIELTDAGKTLYKKAKKLLKEAESIKVEMKDIKDNVHGTLKLGVTSSTKVFVLNRIIQMYNKKYPYVRYEIHSGNTYEVLEMLESGVIDIGIVRTPFSRKDVEVIYLDEEPLMAVGKMCDRLKKYNDKDKIYLKDIKDENIILYRRFENIIYKQFDKEKIRPNIFCINDDAETTMLWAKSGMGIGIVPKSAIQEIDTSKVAVFQVEGEELKSKIAVTYMEDRYLSNAARALVDILKSNFIEK